MVKKEITMTSEDARRTLGIDESQWIVTVVDEELALLKAALRLHADQAADLADKIADIGG